MIYTTGYQNFVWLSLLNKDEAHPTRDLLLS